MKLSFNQYNNINNNNFISFIFWFGFFNCILIISQLTPIVSGINNNNVDGNSHEVVNNNDGKKNLVCVPEILTRGATFPRGDIKLNVGDTLEVNCTLDLTNPQVENLTSNDIEFSFTKHEISESQMDVTIIDNATARLRVQNMNVSTPYLRCDLKRPNGEGKKTIHICQNQIDVGYPPLEVENLRCLARNWNSLNCTWNKPYNPVFTNYELSYKLKSFSMRCGRTSSYNKTESCEWDGQTEPHYQPNYEYITLVMNGSNTLKPEGTIWQYKIKHWSIIIPSPPEKLTTKSDSPYEIELAWDFPHYERFKPGLEHRVTVCTVEHTVNCSVTKFTSRYKESRLIKKIQVPFAYMNYRVEVQMKSAVSNNTEEFWSKPASSEIQTLGIKPESPPLLTPGSYEVFNKYQIRDIFVYWQNIPPYLHYGPDFHLEFKVYENGHLRDDVLPKQVTDSFAVFSDMSMQSYKFEISSVNSNGRSSDFATILVPKSSQAPSAPTSVTKLAYTNGTYEVSWKPSSNADNIISYTVFRCNGSRHLPSQCNVLLEWFEVDAEQNVFIYNGEAGNQVFQFGVSANTKDMSSGMILATCELIFDKVPGKITDVRIGETSPNTILVKWNLDCTYKPGRVEGFRITYCLMKPTSLHTCTDLDNNRRQVNASASDFEYQLQDLEPFSQYMVAISIITRAGESQTSDPIFANTTEAAPSDPPHVRTIDSTNTTGIIAIEAPANPNGVLQKYKIIYKPVGSTKSETNQIEATLRDLVTSNQENYFNLTNLENNLNYSVTAVACTVSCSNASEPAFLMTKPGTTRLTKSPSVNYEHDAFIISWDTPSHVGGPIDFFEVEIKRNGKELYADEPLQIYYKYGQSTYDYNINLQCESNTNISAQVRAVSRIGSEILYGEWSPEGSLSCSGVAAWIIWMIGIGVAITIIVIVAFLSKTIWKKVKFWNKIRIILPPGIELNGVSDYPDQVKRRQNSGGDTQSYGKENLTYLQLASTQSDEAKDFLSSDSTKESNLRRDSIYVDSSQDNIIGVRHTPLQESIDEALAMGVGKICDWSWQPNILSISNKTNDHGLPCSVLMPTTNSLIVEVPSNYSTNSIQSTTVEDGYSEKRISPSPSKPLLSDSNFEPDHNEVEFNPGHDYVIDEDDLEHYKKLGYKNDISQNGDAEQQQQQRTPPHYHNSQANERLGVIEPESVNVSIPNRSNSEDESQPTQSSSRTDSNSSTPTPPPINNSLVSNKGITIPEVPMNNSAYIKWAYLNDDPSTNGDKSLTQPPYYQVGIALDSS